jgi:hypothetical protein
MRMTITVDVRPEVEAELERRASLRGRPVEAYVAALLDNAIHIPEAQLARRTGQELIDACAKVRGALTDEEVDTLFRRNPSFARPVDFECEDSCWILTFRPSWYGPSPSQR